MDRLAERVSFAYPADEKALLAFIRSQIDLLEGSGRHILLTGAIGSGIYLVLALQTLLADRTAIIIAHRLSTVAIADRVLVMEHGRIIEDDTPDALIGGTGKFAQLHSAWKESLV